MLYDKDIREPLFDYLDECYPVNRILEEKRMGRSRADVVMITRDAIFGIEIKSDADTYVRLKRQIKDYDMFYDYNYIVVGSKHAYHIEEHIPIWRGIIIVEEEKQQVDFYILRRPQNNPKVKWKYKLEILWRRELAHIQIRNNMPKYAQKSKAFVVEKLLEKVDLETLQYQICDELLERDYNQITQVIETYRSTHGRFN